MFFNLFLMNSTYSGSENNTITQNKKKVISDTTDMVNQFLVDLFRRKVPPFDS